MNEWEARVDQIFAEHQIRDSDWMTAEQASRVALEMNGELEAAGVSEQHRVQFFTKMVDNLYRDASLTDAQRATIVDVFSEAFGFKVVQMHSRDGYAVDYEVIARPRPEPQ